MLRTDLIELVNSRNAWALVGSGTSVGAGLPTWGRLVKRCLDELSEDQRDEIDRDARFRKALASSNFPICFRRLENVAGRPWLEGVVAASVGQPQRRSALLEQIIDWPFAGYITTNYDTLLEDYLRSAGHGGWVGVGNNDGDLSKLGGPVEHVVWHIHGGTDLPASRLVITDEDYDTMYLHPNRYQEVLRAILATRRLVVLGFGFQDLEVMRILRQLGGLTTPANPIHALMPDNGPTGDTANRIELLERYNVDVTTYSDPDRDHRRLYELVETYGSMVLKRSLEFGKPARACPSYDAEASSLLLYNELALQRSVSTSNDVLSALLKAQILAALYGSGGATGVELVSDLEARIALVQTAADASHEIEEALVLLVEADLVEARNDRYHLTDAGRSLVDTRHGTSRLREDQFASSIRARTSGAVSDEDSADRIAAAAEGFFKQCIDERALGVAMAGFSGGRQERRYHMVALLQGIPPFLEQLSDDDEATALIRTITAVLANPTPEERAYIGLMLQARFGVHLLGMDRALVKVRLEDFAQTVFLLDASVMIQLLARSSEPHPAAVSMVALATRAGSKCVTTDTLAEEVAEHARWALRKVDGRGRLSVQTLEAATGRAGQWPNAFMAGYLNEASSGTAVSMRDYLDSVLEPVPAPRPYGSREVRSALEGQEIQSKGFKDWEGFDDTLFFERDETQRKVTELRKQRGSFKHERQVKAEAEALLVIQQLRAGEFHLNGEPQAGAYFVSHTRLLDRLDRSSSPITVRPSNLLQWLATLRPSTEDDLGVLTSGLLAELDERGLAVVDPSKLGLIFGPLISAAREQLPEEILKYHELVGHAYGESTDRAFMESTDLAVPVVLQSLQAQRAAALESRLKALEKARATSPNSLSAKDQDELARLRADKKQRGLKARSKARSSASRKKGRGRRD